MKVEDTKFKILEKDGVYVVERWDCDLVGRFWKIVDCGEWYSWGFWSFCPDQEEWVFCDGPAFSMSLRATFDSKQEAEDAIAYFYGSHYKLVPGEWRVV